MPEMLVIVLTDLAAICEKLTKHPAVLGDLRLKAGKFVAEFNSLLPVRSKGKADEHAQGEHLLIAMARFLTRVVDVQAEPAIPQDHLRPIM